MKLLLDTHILIWSQLAPEHLVPAVRAALNDSANELWISPLSWWEIGLLFERRRLESEWDGREWARRLGARFPLLEAALTSGVVLTAGEMRFEHRDPVDRFLAATAKCGQLTLVTADDRLLRRTDIALLPNRA